MSKPTTAKHLAAFKKEALFWIDKWGLIDWEFAFIRGELVNIRAQVSHNMLGKCVTFYLTKTWTCPVTPLTMKAIRVCAKHEVIELLIADLTTLALARFVTEDELEHVRHTLVRRLEYIL